MTMYNKTQHQQMNHNLRVECYKKFLTDIENQNRQADDLNITRESRRNYLQNQSMQKAPKEKNKDEKHS